MREFFLSGFFILFLTCSAIANSFDKGRAAFEIGNYETAIQHLKPLGESGVSLAQTYLGIIYSLGGDGIEQNHQEALKWFVLAAEQGEPRGQNALGIAYERGYGVAVDFGVALKWYKRAAEQGELRAFLSLGSMYLFGRGVTENSKEAVKWYRLAADQGHPAGQVSLGYMYDIGKGVPQNNKEAIRWYKLAADQGDSTGQKNLGVMYEFGKGVPRNNEEAVKWYRLAADQGNPTAQVSLGYMYEIGKGVPRNNEEAVKWFRLAADQGNPTGQTNLGVMYENGKGVPQDNKEAIRWYKLAADQGDSTGQKNLGVMYEFGKGVSQDSEKAVKWYKQAADQGNPTAQVNLGYMYENGKGVSRNNEEAVKWYRLAADQKNERAKSSLQVLLFSMGKEHFSQNKNGFGCSSASEFFKKAKELGEFNASRYIEFCETYELAFNGNSNSQFSLGKSFLDGDFLSQDYKNAVKWFRVSAAQGNTNAQRNLGLMYARGTGVSKNEKAALNWYLAAAKQGDEAAGELASELLVRDIVYGSTIDKLHNLAASISGCFSIKDAKCAFDKVWGYLDVSEDGNLSLAELSKFQRDLIKFAYVEEMQNEVEIEEVAAINLTTILFLPITSSSILNSFDYNNDGTLQKEEVFGETEFAKLVGIDAQSLLNGVEFQTLGNKLNSAMRRLPLPF